MNVGVVTIATMMRKTINNFVIKNTSEAMRSTIIYLTTQTRKSSLARVIVAGSDFALLGEGPANLSPSSAEGTA